MFRQSARSTGFASAVIALLLNAGCDQVTVPTASHVIGEWTFVEALSQPPSLSPTIDVEEATQVAIAHLMALDERVEGWKLQDAWHRTGLLEVRRGNETFLTGLDGGDAWVLSLSAPGTAGFQSAESVVVVQSESGKVEAADLLQN